MKQHVGALGHGRGRQRQDQRRVQALQRFETALGLGVVGLVDDVIRLAQRQPGGQARARLADETRRHLAAGLAARRVGARICGRYQRTGQAVQGGPCSRRHTAKVRLEGLGPRLMEGVAGCRQRQRQQRLAAAGGDAQAHTRRVAEGLGVVAVAGVLGESSGGSQRGGAAQVGLQRFERLGLGLVMLEGQRGHGLASAPGLADGRSAPVVDNRRHAQFLVVSPVDHRVRKVCQQAMSPVRPQGGPRRWCAVNSLYRSGHIGAETAGQCWRKLALPGDGLVDVVDRLAGE